VTVRNDGTEVLRVTGLKFTGDAASRLWQEGTCEGESLDPDGSCSITVRVQPGVAGHAQLRIQQNLQGPASLVDIEVDALSTPSSPAANVDLSLYTLPECSVIPGGALSGADNLTILVAVRNSGPAQLSQLVPFTLTSDTGLAGGGNTAVSTGSSFTAMQVDLRPDDYSHTHGFTVTVDPTDEIAELDESNNTIGVTVSLPGRPNQAEDVPCTTP
jgi:CARDB